MNLEASASISVSQLNRLIHGSLEELFPGQWVEGEISDPRSYPSGHTYFTLKDADSQISAVLFKGNAVRQDFKPEHGVSVLAYGRVSTYEKRGQLQFIVSELRALKAGALQQAFERLKKKLSEEGLFDPERKRDIPSFPRTIGIITSRQGAALKDILSVLNRRCPGLRVILFPVPVQGAEAPAAIAAAVQTANDSDLGIDVLLIGRGGGSLEDLWSFNEEAVARAVAGSKIPTISCVGHETDFTICDFAADLRAPTPSAAAELCAPDKRAVLEKISSLDGRLALALQTAAQRIEARLARLLRSPALRDPMRLFEARAQRVDDITGRLEPAMGRLLDRAEAGLSRCAETLNALSPLKVLERGYSIAFHEGTRRVLRSVKDIGSGEGFFLKLKDGDIKAKTL